MIEKALILTKYDIQMSPFPHFKDFKREPLRHFEGDGKVIYTRPFLILGKVTFDEQVNVLERYCKGDVS